MASVSVTVGGSWQSELRELKRHMDKIATKQAMLPLSQKLAAAALELGVQHASKLAPASSMYSYAKPDKYVLGTRQPGAAAHQFGATIRPVSHKAALEGARRAGMKAARMGLAHAALRGAAATRGKNATSTARQFVREAGRSAMLNVDLSQIVAYLTFRVGDHWVRVRQVKLPKREIFPWKMVPGSWMEAFDRVAGRYMRDLFPDMRSR